MKYKIGDIVYSKSVKSWGIISSMNGDDYYVSYIPNMINIGEAPLVPLRENDISDNVTNITSSAVSDCIKIYVKGYNETMTSYRNVVKRVEYEKPCVSVDYYMDLPYKIELECLSEEDGGGYFLSLPELGRYSCNGCGDTLAEAEAMLNEVKRSLFSRLIREGIEIPLPESMRKER